MKDGRLSGSLVIMFPIFLIIALSLPFLLLFLVTVALIFGVVRMSRSAPPGPVSILSVYQGLLPSRSPPLSA